MGTDDPTGKKQSGLEEAATVPAFDPVESAETQAADAPSDRAAAPTGRDRVDTPGEAEARVSASGSGGLGDSSSQTPLLASRLEVGAKIGRFTVIERLGEGGMGVVLAAYDPLLDRKVAIKVVRPQSSGTGIAGQARRRLLREAQAMAKLSHPNVLSVFDAAEIGDQVCIAMEFVDGSTLGHWARAEQRTWREVLDVYTRAGRGLAAAHEAGLIHRDFKPDNVLIDQKGRVRVTDFGLVAAIASTMAEASDRATEPASKKPIEDSASALAMSLTTTGDVMGTPHYMAPEQHLGGHTDERTDQFGFCVALYEALYGERPFAGVTYRQVADRVVAGEVAEPPPEADVPEWVREILLRGLSTNSADRYPSMEALLDALARDPVALRRRRMTIAGVTVVILALAGSLVFVVARDRTRDRSVCAGAEKELAGVWDDDVRQTVAEAFAATGQSYAKETFARVAGVLDGYARAWADMRTEACEATRVYGKQSDSMLDLRMECLDRRRVELRALTELFAQATDRELLDRAVGAVTAAIPIDACADTKSLAAAVPPPEDPALREKVAALRARLAEANARRAAGRYRQGLGIAEEVVTAARETDYSPLLAEALYQLGVLQYRSEEVREAEATLREGAQEAARARNDKLAADTWLTLMMVISTGQRRPEAAMELRPFIEAALARAGDEPLDRANYLREVGNVLMTQGKGAEANQYHLQAIALAEKAYPPGHSALASFHNDLGGSLLQLGKNEEALAQFERVLKIDTETLGENHPTVAWALTNMAVVHNVMGEKDKAIELQKRALEIAEKVQGPEHAIVANMLERVGSFLLGSSRLDEAAPYYERAISILDRGKDASSPRLVRAYEGLASVFWGRQDFDRAREQYEHALSVAERAYGAEHAQSAKLLRAEGLLDRERKAFASAIEEHRRALGIRQRLLGPDHGDVVESLFDLGDDYWVSGKLAAARSHYERALAMEERLLGPNNATVAASLNSMGELLREFGSYAEAKRYYERSLAMWQTLSDASPDSIASPLSNLGEIACAEKRFVEAREKCSRGLALVEKVRGKDAPDLAYFLTCIGRAELGLGNAKVALQHLERALALRQNAHHPPLELASTRLNLARALLATGGDRTRAQSLAAEARQAHENAAFVPVQLRAELAAWDRAQR